MIKQLFQRSIAGIVLFYAATAVDAADLRIDNVRIYQPEQQAFSAPSRIYIQKGVIERIAPMSEQPDDAAKVMDGKSSYAVAGMTDLHVHLGSSGSNFGSDFQYLPVTAHLNSYLSLGVTNAVDLFSFDPTIAQVRELKQQQTTADIYFAGALFTNPGGHGTQFGGAAAVIEKDEDIPALWQQHLARKPSVTKAVLETFGGRGATLTDSQLAKLGQLSKEAGLPFFVHVSTLEDAKRAIKGGATVLAHGVNLEPVDDEFIQLMQQNAVAYVPTLAVYLNHSDELHHKAVSSQKAALKPIHEKLKHCLFDKVASPNAWMSEAWQKRDIAFKNLMKLHKAGITIGTGSDAGNPYTMHGPGLHNELKYQQAAGLSNADILNAATINAARILRQPAIGKIAKGKAADLLITSTDPLTDLTALQRPTTVIKNGKIFAPEKLHALNKAIAPQGSDCKLVEQGELASSHVIDSFDEQQTAWQAISDTMQGGQSQAEINVQAEQLHVKTQLGKPQMFGAWGGAQLQFPQVVDASEFEGIKLVYKASGNPFSLSVHHADVKDWDHFQTVVQPTDEWQTLKIPFAQLQQMGYGQPIDWSPKKLVGLGIVWRSMQPSDATHQLHIKALEYY